MTGGLVTDQQAYAVLPEVSPAVTLLLSVLSMLPPLWTLWFKPNMPTFVRAVYMCGFGTFLFGWHVHEKAIMLVTIPLCLIATDSKQNARRLLSVSAAGYAALFPLLYEPQETVLKCALLVTYCAAGYVGLCTCLGSSSSGSGSSGSGSAGGGGGLGYGWLETAYLAGLVPLQLFVSIVHPAMFAPKLPFLPLMATSVYCGVGLVGLWLADLVDDFVGTSNNDGSNNSKDSTSNSNSKHRNGSGGGNVADARKSSNSSNSSSSSSSSRSGKGKKSKDE